MACSRRTAGTFGIARTAPSRSRGSERPRQPRKLDGTTVGRGIARDCNNILKALVSYTELAQPDVRRAAGAGWSPLIVGEALRLVQSTLPRHVVVVFEPGRGELPVLADPTQIHQVMMNLGLNAGQAMREEGGMLTVRLQPETVVPGAEPPAPGLSPGR